MDAYIFSQPKLKNTYELETQQYKTNNILYNPYNSNEEFTGRSAQERLSLSPPIILCEASDFRNSRTHRHRYLFYPSASRLSPYPDLHTYSNFKIVTGNDQTKADKNTNFDLDKEIDKLKERHRQIKEEYSKRQNELNDNKYENNKSSNRPESVNYNATRGKYKDLLDKSNDLKNSIENLIKEEEGKRRGPLGYYNDRNIRNCRDNRDNEYDEFINRQNNLFNTTNSLKNWNINNENNDRDNKYNTQFNKNSNNNYNPNNNDYNNEQFKSGTLRDRGGSESNYFNKNKNYTTSNNNNNNLNSKSNNFNNEEDNNNANLPKKYISYKEEDYNDNQYKYPKGSNLINNDEDYKDNKDIYSKMGNKSNKDEDYNDNKDIYSKNKDGDYNDRKDIYSKSKNRINNEEDYNDRKGIYSKEKNENNNEENYNDHKDIYSKTNNLDYNDNNDIFSNKNNFRTYNNLDSNNNTQKNYINKNDINSKSKNLNNELDNYSSYNNNNNIIYSSDINNNNEINMENNKTNSKGYNNNQNISNRINNDEDQKLLNNGNKINITGKQNKKGLDIIDGIATLPETMVMGNRFVMNKNTDSLMNNNNNYFSKSQGNNDINNSSNQGNYNSSNVLRNKNNQNENDFNNKNRNNNYMNIMDSANTDNIISNNGEGSGKLTKLVLADENNFEFLSEDRKPFVGEEIQDKKVIDGNNILVITKGGESVVPNVLKNYEGEILGDKNGNAIMGRGNIYYYENNGELVISTNKKLLEGDKVVPVIVKRVKFNPSIMSGTLNSNGDNNFANSIPLTNSYGINQIRGNINGDNSGLGTSQMRRRHLNKNRMKMFPKGDGDAKPPIIKKRKRKIRKK